MNRIVVYLTVLAVLAAITYLLSSTLLPSTAHRFLCLSSDKKNKPNLLSPDALCLRTIQFLTDLGRHEKRLFSQNGEDGITTALLQRVGTTNKYYVEFGVHDGLECNTRILREQYNWTGLMMDAGNQNAGMNLHKEFIYPSNIVQLFKKYNVHKQFDLLSVDTDYKDFWIIKSILQAGYRPRILITEMNAFLRANQSLTVTEDFNADRADGRSRYYGFSTLAGYRLARRFNYSMVYCEQRGVNCFYVIDGEGGFGEACRISDYLKVEQLWKYPFDLTHVPDTMNRPWFEVTEQFLSAIHTT